MIQIRLESASATESLGGRLARAMEPGGIVFLAGDLGAGKTTLVRGFLRSLGCTGAVKSPTYTIIEPYTMRGKRVVHVDLYRIVDVSELEFVGIRELLDGENIFLVEWPERGREALPPPDLVIALDHAGDVRHCRLQARSATGETILARLGRQDLPGSAEFAPPGV